MRVSARAVVFIEDATRGLRVHSVRGGARSVQKFRLQTKSPAGSGGAVWWWYEDVRKGAEVSTIQILHGASWTATGLVARLVFRRNRIGSGIRLSALRRPDIEVPELPPAVIAALDPLSDLLADHHFGEGSVER